MNHQNPNQRNGGRPTPYYLSLPPKARAVALATAADARVHMHMSVQAQAANMAVMGAAAAQDPIDAVARGPIIRATVSSKADKARAATATTPAIFVRNTTKSNTTKPKHKKRTKTYNNFNIFFMLERQLLLQSRGGGINAIETPIDTSNSPMVKHKQLHLPPLCQRYNHLPLTNNWFLELLSHQSKKRKHCKTHGLIPFKELAQTVAKNYHDIDDETQLFVNEVAKRLGWHCKEMEVAEERQEERQLDLQQVAPHSNSSSENCGDHLYRMASSVAMNVPKAGLNVLGASVYASKKRNDIPAVSVAGRIAPMAPVTRLKQPSLSNDEVSTVQQHMGMTSHSPPQGHPAVNESDLLQLDLAHAMKLNLRLESDRRISNSSSENCDDRLNRMASSVAMNGPKVGLDVLGASVYASKKRNDIPAVSVAGRVAHMAPVTRLKQPSLSNDDDEASTVQQHMGMKSHSPPQGHPAVNELDLLQLELAHAMNLRLECDRRIRLIKEQMSMHHASRAAQSHAGAHNRQDTALHHEQVAAHPRATPQYMISPGTLRHFPAGYEQYLSMLTSASHRASGSDSSRGVAPTSIANTADNKCRFFHPDVNSLDDVERGLLNETVLHRLISNADTGTGASQPSMEDLEALGYPMDVMRGLSTGQHPRGASQDHHLQCCEAPMAAPLKKRAKYSATVENESKNERADGIVNGEPYPPNTASTASDTAENQSELEIYKDLYSKLAASASARDTAAKRDHPMTENDASQQCDLALMDRLIAPSNGVDPVTMHHPMMDSVVRGGYSPHDASHHSRTYRAAGHYLSQLAATHHPAAARGVAQHHRPTSITSPPVNPTPPPIIDDASHPAPGCVTSVSFAASRVSASVSPSKQNPSLLEIVNTASLRKPQFGLSYNDIMGAWRDRNRENTANHAGGISTAGKGENHGDRVDNSMKKETFY